MLSTTGPGLFVSSQHGGEDDLEEDEFRSGGKFGLVSCIIVTYELAIGYFCCFEPGKNSYSYYVVCKYVLSSCT